MVLLCLVFLYYIKAVPAASQYGVLAGSSAAGGMLNYPGMLPGQDLAHHMSSGLDFAASYNPQLVSFM